MAKANTVHVAIMSVSIAIGLPLLLMRMYLPAVEISSSFAGNACFAEGGNLDIARASYAQKCSEPRKDCDPIASGWVCGSIDIPANYASSGGVSAGQGVCTATGANLDIARAAYAQKCSAPRKDCDPVNGQWVCSSAQIGAASGSGGNNVNNNLGGGNAPNTAGPTQNSQPVSPSPAPTPSAPVTGGSVAVSSSQGMIVLEAENTSSSLGQWRRSTAIGGYSGSGHLTYDGGTTSGWIVENGRSVSRPGSSLRYTFEAPQTGTYRLMMRLHRSSESGRADHSNDGFVRLEGDFAAPYSSPTRAELASDHKYFGGGTSWAWTGATPLDIHPRKERAEYVLKAGQQYTLVLSGRSKGWSVDRIVFAPTSVSNAAAQTNTQASPTQPASPSTPTVSGGVTPAVTDRGTRSVGRYKAGDMVALHYDYCPDPDDGHATVANKAVVDKYGLNYIVVGGTCGYDILDRFKPEGRRVLNAVHGSRWLDAMNDRQGSINAAAQVWAATLRAGKNVHVAEGGQSDFTADVLRKVKNDAPGVNLKKVYVYQHSCCTSLAYNEKYTRSSNLNYIKNVASYVTVANGNAGGNGSPDLGYVYSPSFERIALASSYGSAWRVAFDFLNPSCSNQIYQCKLDFSDTVELLAIVDDLGFADVNGFAQRYLQGSQAVLETPAPSVATTSVTPGLNWADSYSANGQCYCATTFDHNIGGVQVATPQGQKTVREICAAIGAGPGKGNNPVYNDVQCGHGPANDAGDETICPGRVDQGSNGCAVKGPTWNLDRYFPASERSNTNTNTSASTISNNERGGCEVSSFADLASCMSQARNLDRITIQKDLTCAGGYCCPGGKSLIQFSGVSNLVIEGNGKRILRTTQQRSCSLVDILNSSNVTINNLVLDDDESDPACAVADNCPRMVHVRNSDNVRLSNMTVTNSKGYAIYINTVNKFEYLNNTLKNSGVLGLYVGHGDTPSRNILIADSKFYNNATNALALLGVAGNSFSDNVVRNNEFVNNHIYGRWPVEPRYGTGITGGGQVYIARASGVTIKDNIIRDGYCDGCRGGVTGIELSEPRRASLSNVLVEDNVIRNNTAAGISGNQGAPLNQNIIIRGNQVSGSPRLISADGARIE